MYFNGATAKLFYYVAQQFAITKTGSQNKKFVLAFFHKIINSSLGVLSPPKSAVSKYFDSRNKPTIVFQCIQHHYFAF